MDAENDATKEILERALDLLLALSGSRVAAIYACSGDEHAPTLVAGIRIDQRSLDHVSAAWQFGHDALGLGLRYECPEGSIVEPVLIDRKVRALIYLDRVSEECPEDQFALVKSLIARRCGEDAAAPLPTPAFDQREHLLLMLERNEWNIARAARLLGVSRLTVYRRLRRLGLARPEEGSDQALVLAPASSRN